MMRDFFSALFEFAVFALPMALLLLGWHALRRNRSPQPLFLAWWVAVLFAMAIAGILLWREDMECSRVAMQAIATSSIWFSGPVLVWTIAKPWRAWWSWLAVILLPAASVPSCVFLLMGTHQVWGW